MKIFHIISFLFLGIFMMPNNAFACGEKIKTEKSCCTKEPNTKTEKKSCCNEDSKKACGGKCGHSSCTAASIIQFSVIITCDFDFNNNNFKFSSEKHKFYHSETFLSSGFHTLWLIPKIS